jgi:hypothetical protein
MRSGQLQGRSAYDVVIVSDGDEALILQSGGKNLGFGQVPGGHFLRRQGPTDASLLGRHTKHAYPKMFQRKSFPGPRISGQPAKGREDTAIGFLGLRRD